MTTITVDLPDTLFFELEQAAALRHISTELLLIEMARHNLKEIKAEQHFHERAARGIPERGLALLDEVARRSH
ncbi:MAG: toxin-antitoxin system HicB family antitoxin [Methylococcaceae bacterium]|nr:toxin-antitoxin system HicB family antitoxin [Methylococcaceae bacterium]